MLKNVVRDLRDGPLTLARVRRAFPKAYVNGAVRFRGDIRRTRLAAGVSILGPTVLVVTDGGGLSGARLEVGERTFIGELNNIRCAGAPVLIGRDCLISQLVTIVGTNHGTAAGTPVVDQPWSGEGVVIGDDVWVGAGSVILPGARIGNGVIVAANSVVRGEVPDNAIVAGSIAKVVGHRS